VFAEVEQGKDKPYFIDILKQAWISVEKVSDRKVLPPIHVLDAGEAEVIMLAAERKADLVLIDEALGRKFAKQANLKVTGTIGVLVKAKELGLLEKVVPLLEEMQQKGIWISKSLKEKITALVGE
jgi:predicted nucleic acid-binding protein